MEGNGGQNSSGRLVVIKERGGSNHSQQGVPLEARGSLSRRSSVATVETGKSSSAGSHQLPPGLMRRRSSVDAARLMTSGRASVVNRMSIGGAWMGETPTVGVPLLGELANGSRTRPLGFSDLEVFGPEPDSESPAEIQNRSGSADAPVLPAAAEKSAVGGWMKEPSTSSELYAAEQAHVPMTRPFVPAAGFLGTTFAPESSPEGLPTLENKTPSIMNIFPIPDNFGSQKKALTARPSQLATSTVRKKQIYLQLTFTFGAILLMNVIADYVYITVFEEPSFMMNWLVSLLIVQVLSFCLFLLAFIYANEAGDIHNLNWSIGAGVLNLVAFILRIYFEFTYLDYIPES